jgi:N-acyl-D-aspartate/D-glutamate deacylase
LDERCDVGDLTLNSCEDDLRAVMTHARTVVGSDGLDVGEKPHPRLYGTFPRVLGQYVREEVVLPMAAAIRKMTGQTADLFRLRELGYLQPGYRADIVVFDPAAVSDTATYENPRQFAVGIEHVIVGGVSSILAGQLTGDFGGRNLKRGAQ